MGPVEILEAPEAAGLGLTNQGQQPLRQLAFGPVVRLQVDYCLPGQLIRDQATILGQPPFQPVYDQGEVGNLQQLGGLSQQLGARQEDMTCLRGLFQDIREAGGDTLRAIDEGKVEQRIRLAGIDTPERGQPFGNVARERLAALTMGQAVEVHVEDRDRYGRTVARLEVGGLDVCLQMVADGLAWHYTRYSDDADLAAAERQARAARRGLWRDAAPVAPWDWRASEAEQKRKPTGR